MNEPMIELEVAPDRPAVRRFVGPVADRPMDARTALRAGAARITLLSLLLGARTT